MKKINRAAIVVCALLACGAASAATWPDKPIKLVVPFAPGGTADIIGRIAAEHLGKALGQPVIVENRSGAGGSLGAATVAKARGDGYTLGLATVSTQVTNPILMRLNYSPDKDLAAIVQIASVPNVLVVSNSVPARDLKEFVALIKDAPMKYNYGSAGQGSINHITCAGFTSYTGTSMTHVPYKGASGAMSDLLGGALHAMCDQVTSSLPFIKSGKLHALAVAAPERIPELRDVPTFAEQGYPELNTMAWYGLMAPSGTPEEILQKINSAMRAAAQSPQYQNAIRLAGAVPTVGTKEEFRRVIDEDVSRIQGIVKRSDIKIE